MQPDQNWLENPEIFRVNRLDAHSDHRFYESQNTFEQNQQTLFQSLNGRWRFCFSKNPAERPVDFYKEDYDISNFDSILVPGHIELQGYDQIQYINTMYPWDGHSNLRPPHVDNSCNSVGSYLCQFDLNEELLEKRVCISFQGVEQACYVWLNGTFIGYAEDSFTPSDFDLTPYIYSKNNRLCVEVYKRSSASWLEDQDFFRFFGIFRDVFLYAKPNLHLEDIWLQAGLSEDNTTGTLSVRLKVSALQNEVTLAVTDPSSLQVQCNIIDPLGRSIYHDFLELKSVDSTLITDPLTFEHIVPWNHKCPIVYDVHLSLFDSNGVFYEIVPYSIGFRRFEKKDGLFLLNGERIVFNGVNRHEWNATTGRCICDDDMYADMIALKKHNINAVRTSHYPNQSLWYELCDKNGIYMIDETNLESHGSWQKMGKCEPSWNVPGNNPLWLNCVLDRAQSMFERDKNHTSILFWSCGNESYAGTCIEAMSDYFHTQDPTRLVHYEGVVWNREFEHLSDVESHMYSSPETIKAYLENNPSKPFIICEYMHNMGNSIGGMERYIRLAEQYEKYQGGFIWDFKDQALWQTDGFGQRTLAYGGDFDDRPTDYSFSGNGLLFADGTIKSTLEEVRYWYKTIEERNAKDQLNARLRAAAKEQIENELKQHMQNASAECPLTIVEGDVTLGVHGNGFRILFSYDKGGPVSVNYNGTEWLYRTPKPAFWRASTENDEGNGFSSRSGTWMSADLWSRCTSWEVTQKTPDAVTICYQYVTCTSPETTVDISYNVDKLGAIHVTAIYHGTEGLPGLPAFGVRFETPYQVGNVSWLGLSGETYPDRYKGAQFGMHQETPSAPNYLVPQEYGCHINTLWAKLSYLNHRNQQMSALQLFAEGDKEFAFSALPYTPHQLESAKHVTELPKTDRTVISILGAMRGVGGIDSWSADVEEAYHVDSKKDIIVRFCLKPE